MTLYSLFLMLARRKRKILGSSISFLHSKCDFKGFLIKISKFSLHKGGFIARSNLKKERNKGGRGGSLLGIILIHTGAGNQYMEPQSYL